jgi:hypothetical protein
LSTFLEDLVRDDAPAAQAPEVAAEPKPSEPVSDGRARDEAGRFVAKTNDEAVETGVKETPAAQPQQAQPPQPEPPSGDEGKLVPLAALNALKAKLAETEAKLAQGSTQPKPAEQSQQPQPETPTPKGPDFSFDPSSFGDDRNALFEARLHQTKMEMSATMAAQQFGEDAFNEAWVAFDTAAKSDPEASAISMRLLNHPHPMGEIVKWHRRQREFSQLSEAGGLEKLRERMRAELMAEMQGGTQTAPVVTPAPAAIPMPAAQTPNTPPSLAKGGAGSRDAPQTMTDNEAFDALFDKSKRQPRKR